MTADNIHPYMVGKIWAIKVLLQCQDTFGHTHVSTN